MLKPIFDNLKKKSLKERFLLVLGILFFLAYLVLGLFIIFIKELPIVMDATYRLAFGIILIVYAFFRFIRLINKNN